MRVPFVTIGAAVLALLLGVAAGPAQAASCKKACGVFFGHKGCRNAVLTASKDAAKQCKTLCSGKGHHCQANPNGYTTLTQCRTAARNAGKSTVLAKCGKTARDACKTCCAAGGTGATCAHSPSGAFID